MKKYFMFLAGYLLASLPVFAQQSQRYQLRENIPLDSIVLSDPAILADQKTKMYYMTGTGGRLWKSKDLKLWTGPYRVAETDPDSWMGPTPMIWAAELHAYKDKYYYFATFTNRDVIIDTVKGNSIERRASHILVSDHPAGPYVPMKDPIYLPADKPTLDGTFWVDSDGKPYMVYCYEWLQNWDGTMEKIELKPDLSGSIGEGQLLFRASDSPWSCENDENGKLRRSKVTDGPYLFRTGTGRLGMIWTSWVFDIYMQGVAYSESGTLDGPWIHEEKPITPPNFGHGMLFQTFEGKWLMSVHSHENKNGHYHRTPHLFEVDLSGDRLIVGKKYSQTSDITVNTITEEGAWCWFADPRALFYENDNGTIKSTYIGYIDVQGNIKATQIDHLTNRTNEVLIRSWFQPDDHNNPTFLVLPDERIMIFYSRHTDEPCFYYRISQKPGDITTLGKEIRLETANNTTYPSPFILSDDPDHIYLCWRGIGWHPTIARLTMPDKEDNVRFDWGPFQILQSQQGGRGVRPYAKYMSNGKDKIYLAYTTTHPDNQSVNYIYFNYIDINSHELKDIKGQKLAEVGSGVLHNVEATAEYKNSYPDAVAEDSPYRNWLWEISIADEEKPVIAVVRISEDKNSHEYYHVRWTGDEWHKTFLSHAGGHFHQTPGLELCYSGGMAIDKTDPSVIYGSVPVEGHYGNVYELKRFTVTPEGTLASTEQLTYDSPKNNIRPFVISNEGGVLQMVWMQGDYYDWIVSSARPGYPTAIRTNMDIPAGEINSHKDLLYQNPGSIASGDNMEVIDIPKSDEFTFIATVAVDHDAYWGEIIKTDAFAYGLKEGEESKPYIKVGNREIVSSNVLANSDSWKTQNRGTTGIWHAPVKPESFQLAITCENGVFKTYIDGLVDQYVEVEGLSLSELVPGTFKGALHNIRIYNRVLSQDEIKSHMDI